MSEFVISGTGLFTPPETLSNRELVEAFNCYVDQFNQDNDEAIKRGDIEALEKSSEAFIEKASGIKSRFCMNKSGIIDPKRMKPYLKERTDEEHSLQCEMSIHAAKEAITKAQITPDNIGMVRSCTYDNETFWHSFRRDGKRAGRNISWIKKL